MMCFEQVRGDGLICCLFHQIRGLARGCAEALLRWATALGGRETPLYLPSYYLMQKYVSDTASARVGHELTYRSIELPINPKYSKYGLSTVRFECLDVCSGLAAIIANKNLVRTEADLLRTQDVRHAKDGTGRIRTREMNSGSLWERTENELFGSKLALWAQGCLSFSLMAHLWFNVALCHVPQFFIFLANLPESIRFTMVLSRCIFIYLMFRPTSHRPPLSASCRRLGLSWGSYRDWTTSSLERKRASKTGTACSQMSV